MDKAMSVIVVGAGQAGAALVAKLRALGHEGPITLIGDEPVLPYQRPPLSKKYLLGEMELERLFLRPESFYTEQGIELVTGHRVTAIDPEARSIALDDGRSLHWDRLALTTGARPRRLPDAIGGGLDGAYLMRNLADADAIAPEFVPGRRVVIVGGGYIGLEAAAVAASKGLIVTLLEAAPRILARVASEATADWFRALHESQGVDIREAVHLDRLEGEGHVTGARLGDGTVIPADFVLVGIGVEPDTALAAKAGLAIDNGIAVDERCHTSAAGIFAAGDCASMPWAEGRLRLESVPNAIEQAEVAAAAMLGEEIRYTPNPWFWSDQFDVKLQIAGLGTGHDRTVTRPGAREGSLSIWYYAGRRLIAVDAMNDPRAYMAGKRMIESGISPEPEAIADPKTDLKVLMSG
ncbi:MAG: NAD(P)/FAD-dependent oxidoreductase [Rubricella sp.]